MTKPADQFYSNESKIRLIAFFVLLLIILYGLTHWLIIPIILIIDFALRGSGHARFSPLARLSEWQVNALRLPIKPVYLPLKRFAARIGFLLCVIIALIDIFQWNTLPVVIILGFFAALESLAGICSGCYVYQLLQRFKKVPDLTPIATHGDEEDWR